MKGARLREGGTVRSWSAGGDEGASGQDEKLLLRTRLLARCAKHQAEVI
jgi:hypothetical protein